MASIVSAGTTSATALNMSADTTGILQLASNNGTVALTVNTSQNVGIGTSSQTARLQIEGTTDATQRIIVGGSGNVSSFKLNYNGSEVAQFQTYQNSEVSFGATASAALYLVTNNSTRLAITSAGLVGIGTANPTTTLQLNGSTAFANVNGTGTVANGWSVSNTNTANAFYFAQDNSTGNNFNTGTAYGPVLWTNASSQTFVTNSGTNTMTFSSGNLLVGTTTAVGKLTVNGAINSATYAVNITAGNTDTMFTMAASQSYVGYVTEGASNTHSVFFASCAEGSSTAVVTSIYQSSANTVVSASGLNIRVFNGAGSTRTMKMTVTRLV